MREHFEQILKNYEFRVIVQNKHWGGFCSSEMLRRTAWLLHMGPISSSETSVADYKLALLWYLRKQRQRQISQIHHSKIWNPRHLLFCIQQWKRCLYDRDMACLLCGTIWIFKWQFAFDFILQGVSSKCCGDCLVLAHCTRFVYVQQVDLVCGFQS